jgi:hypothetical protein
MELISSVTKFKRIETMTNRKTNIQKGGQAAATKKTQSNKTGVRLWSTITIVSVLAVLGGVLFLAPSFNNNAGATEITVYKSPTCGCCSKWVDHLRNEGFKVKTINQDNMSSIKSSSGVTANLQSCHTAFVDGYVVEGHVPADDIKRLLRERPKVTGISAPGMPMGSPGMEGQRKDYYDVVTFDRNGRTTVYARH